jgi:DNA-binding CsgD family transcriptional regulator
MPKPPRKSDILTEALLRELYLSQNKTLQEIAIEYGFQTIIIKNLMERYGIERISTLRKSDILTERLLRELYISQNKTLEEIGKEYGFSKQTIKVLMEKCGITRRSQSKARYMAIKKGKFPQFHNHDINKHFFKNGHQKWLGF